MRAIILSLTGLFLSITLCFGQSSNESWNKAAFEAKTINDVYASLGISNVSERSPYIFVKAPDIAENGFVVPVTIQITNNSDVNFIALIGDKNTEPLICFFTYSDIAIPSMSVRAKLRETSNYISVVKTKNNTYEKADNEVKVTMGANTNSKPGTAGDIKLRATISNDITSVKVLIKHPMDPSLFIKQIWVEVNGKIAISGQLSTWLSVDPYFGFELKNSKKGDKIIFKYLNSNGETKSAEAIL